MTETPVMYCTPDDVKQLSGVTPQSLKLDKDDEDGLLFILTDWILQCKSLIDSYCHTTFETEVPPAVKSVCLRMAANYVALGQVRKDTPLVKVNDWSVQVSSVKIFTQDLKDDLEWFVVDKSNKSDKVDMDVISGDDPYIED